MSSYEEMIQRRRRAQALCFELWALGLDAYAERDAERPAGFKVVVEGLKFLNPNHAARLMRLVRANEAALAEVLPKRRTHLHLVRRDGPAP